MATLCGWSFRVKLEVRTDCSLHFAAAVPDFITHPPPTPPLPLRTLSGRSVKWLKKIIISDQESQHHLHFWVRFACFFHSGRRA